MNAPAQQAAAPACTLRSTTHDRDHCDLEVDHRHLVLTSATPGRATETTPAPTESQLLDAAYTSALAAELSLRRLLAELRTNAADELQGDLSRSERALLTRMKVRNDLR